MPVPPREPLDNAPDPSTDDPGVAPNVADASRPRGDGGQPPIVAAEHPKGRSGRPAAPLPPDHPSQGMIDEAGVQQ